MLRDVRRALGDDRGRERYLEGHVPGAVVVDLGTEPAALAGAGIESALWPGSWPGWTGDPSRPVVTGAGPA